MKNFLENNHFWLRYLFTVLLVIFAFSLRIWPLQSLENKLAWLTFYPVVIISAVYGGFSAGIVATIFTCILINFFWYFVTIRPFINDQSDLLGMVVFFFNCTITSLVAEGMRRANKRAKKAQQQAQNANEAKSLFLANMSHELRTPLNAILGYSQLLHKDSGISKRQKDFLETINNSGEHLLSLINQVLEISKIEVNRVTLDLNTFDLHDLIHNLKKLFQVKTDKKDLIFEIRGVETLPKFVIADETKLRIILINIIGNSIKFTESGKIVVTFSLEEKIQNKIKLKVIVEDTGYGIAPEDISKLFQPFVQTESGKKIQSGTGLGLVISKSYIQLMEGSISIESKPGIGTTISFTINIQKGEKTDIKDEIVTQNIIGLKNKNFIPKILIVDDDENNRNLMFTLLKEVGFDIKDSINGRQALDIYNEWKPDLIWMDIRMPVMNGLEATKIIKSSTDRIQPKIILISAHVLKEELTEITQSGCDDFLAKPYKIESIFEYIKKHLVIEYIYREELNSTKKNTLEIADIIQKVGPVYDEIKEEILTAVRNTDSLSIQRIAKEIKQSHPDFAEFLILNAKNFDYDKISELISK